jgi:hypothetical protein
LPIYRIGTRICAERDHFKRKRRDIVARSGCLLGRAILQENRIPLFLIALDRNNHCAMVPGVNWSSMYQ